MKTTEIIIEGREIKSGKKISATLEDLLDGYHACVFRCEFQDGNVKSMRLYADGLLFPVEAAYSQGVADEDIR